VLDPIHAPRSSPTDAQLWRRAARGDRDAFGDIFDRHARAIYNFCFRRTANWAHAEDLTSATFLLAWRRRREVTLVGESALPWLYGVATRLVWKDERKAARGRSAVAALPVPRGGSHLAEDAAARLDDQRRMRELLGALARLSRAEQDVVALCTWQGLTYEEAAAALDLPVGTVRSRLSRARSRLRAADAENKEDD